MREMDETAEAPRREIVYAVLAVVSLVIGIARIPETGDAPAWLKVVDTGIAVAFLRDWLRRVRESPRRARYAWRSSYEILTFIPFTLLPSALAAGEFLRGARLIRILQFARYGRIAKVGISFARLPRRARYLQRVVRNAQLANILLTGLLTVSVGASVLLYAERDAIGASGYGGAFWWSLNIFTTVAYSIPVPQTPIGYVTTGTLAVAGVSYIGVLTASLASAILRTDIEPND